MLQLLAPPTYPVTLLVIDDDLRSQHHVRMHLESLGHRVVTLERVGDALAALEAQQPALVVLDVQVADGDGFALCQQIRQRSSLPLIIVSALSDSQHKVRAFELGADDYLTKPYDAYELSARIEAVLRRVQRPQPAAPPPFVNGPLTIDFEQHLVQVHGQEIVLSSTEYRLLEQLARNVGRTLVTDALLRQVWGAAYQGAYASVHLYISRLRRKLGDSARQPRLIITQAGVGYMMPRLLDGDPPRGAPPAR